LAAGPLEKFDLTVEPPALITVEPKTSVEGVLPVPLAMKLMVPPVSWIPAESLIRLRLLAAVLSSVNVAPAPTKILAAPPELAGVIVFCPVKTAPVRLGAVTSVGKALPASALRKATLSCGWTPVVELAIVTPGAVLGKSVIKA
jgi:hypothetical protein